MRTNSSGIGKKQLLRDLLMRESQLHALGHNTAFCPSNVFPFQVYNLVLLKLQCQEKLRLGGRAQLLFYILPIFSCYCSELRKKQGRQVQHLRRVGSCPMATRCQFENSNDVGVFAKLTNAYCLVALGGSENFYRYSRERCQWHCFAVSVHF